MGEASASSGPPVWVVLAVFLLGGCAASPTGTLRVDVRTDLAAGLEFDAVTVSLEGLPGSAQQTSAEGQNWRKGVRVGRWEGVFGYQVVIVAARKGSSIVVQRRALTEVDGPTGVTVLLTRNCRGVRCPGDGSPRATACLGGRCVPPECVFGTEEACGPPACEADGDCDEARDPSCASSTCSAGVCLTRFDDERCDLAETCTPSGCRARETDVITCSTSPCVCPGSASTCRCEAVAGCDIRCEGDCQVDCGGHTCRVSSPGFCRVDGAQNRTFLSCASGCALEMRCSDGAQQSASVENQACMCESQCGVVDGCQP